MKKENCILCNTTYQGIHGHILDDQIKNMKASIERVNDWLDYWKFGDKNIRVYTSLYDISQESHKDIKIYYPFPQNYPWKRYPVTWMSVTVHTNYFYIAHLPKPHYQYSLVSSEEVLVRDVCNELRKFYCDKKSEHPTNIEDAPGGWSSCLHCNARFRFPTEERPVHSFDDMVKMIKEGGLKNESNL